MSRIKLRVFPLGDPRAFRAAQEDAGVRTLRELLERAPAVSLDPILPEYMFRALPAFDIQVEAGGPLHAPPGLVLGLRPHNGTGAGERPAPAPGAPSPSDGAAAGKPAHAHPDELQDGTATRLAYGREIDDVAGVLRAGLSVLVFCDKLVVEHLWQDMVRRSAQEAQLLHVPDDESGPLARTLRQRQLAQLTALTRTLKHGQVLVIPHLDLLAGGGDNNLSAEAREVVDVLYGASGCLLLAFADRSIGIPEVLAARFAARVQIAGLARTVRGPDALELPAGTALVTAGEAARFKGFDPEGLYKNIAGMNPVRLRQAIQYAVREHGGGGQVGVERLYQAIRAFKAKTSANFEVPDVSFDDIGGYDDVKAGLQRALELMKYSFDLPHPKLQRELIPRGFIFHGPPGTGKTLFAKAIANSFNATIQVVSGPEVTDMYVGESERKVREIFAEARRNAPAVVVFDEFDSIASRRSGRDDGGSRAGNALVAQILTEMDGFRPDVPMLVIGTTNRLDIIDEALLRPSRFQPVAIGLPDRSARRAIARVHAAHFGIPIGDALLEILTAATDGFNGDEIRSLFREACVGKFCQRPPLEPDAHRLGQLVGRVRETREQRAKAAPAPAVRPDRRPGPSGPMIALTPTRPAAPAPNAPAPPQTAPAAAAAPRTPDRLEPEGE